MHPSADGHGHGSLKNVRQIEVDLSECHDVTFVNNDPFYPDSYEYVPSHKQWDTFEKQLRRIRPTPVLRILVGDHRDVLKAVLASELLANLDREDKLVLSKTLRSPEVKRQDVCELAADSDLVEQFQALMGGGR